MEVGGGDGGVESEGSDLGEGVDAGVGASGALGQDVSPVMRWMASARVPWTVGRPGWTCQPWKGVPS